MKKAGIISTGRCGFRRMLDFGHFDFGQLADVEIGRSRNWPKSNLWCLLYFFFLLFLFCFFFFFCIFVFCFVPKLQNPAFRPSTDLQVEHRRPSAADTFTQTPTELIAPPKLFFLSLFCLLFLLFSLFLYLKIQHPKIGQSQKKKKSWPKSKIGRSRPRPVSVERGVQGDEGMVWEEDGMVRVREGREGSRIGCVSRRGGGREEGCSRERGREGCFKGKEGGGPGVFQGERRGTGDGGEGGGGCFTGRRVFDGRWRE